MTLTSLSDHSDYLSASTYSDSEKLKLYRKRVGFGKQPLELWMLVPCDECGNVLDKKIIWADPDKDYIFESDKFDKYQQAKERCLFEGLRIEKDMYHATKRTFYFICDKRIALLLEFHSGEKEFKFDLLHDFKTIEDLVKLDFELTPTAIKQLGYE